MDLALIFFPFVVTTFPISPMDDPFFEHNKRGSFIEWMAHRCFWERISEFCLRGMNVEGKWPRENSRKKEEIHAKRQSFKFVEIRLGQLNIYDAFFFVHI